MYIYKTTYKCTHIYTYRFFMFFLNNNLSYVDSILKTKYHLSFRIPVLEMFNVVINKHLTII